MTEQEIERILSEDYSAGTEAFRDTLLARCLDVLGDESRFRSLDDEELDMLAAAGSIDDLVNATRPEWDGMR